MDQLARVGQVQDQEAKVMDMIARCEIERSEIGKQLAEYQVLDPEQEAELRTVREETAEWLEWGHLSSE